MVIMIVMVVRVIIMTVTFVTMVVMLMGIVVTIFGIFFLAPDIRLIPGCLDEYLECGVQVNDHDEEYEAEKSENREKYELQSYNAKKCNNARSHEGKYEKEECDDDRPEVEENHRIVELGGDTDVPDCHSCWCWERLSDSFFFEDDEHFRIGKTHIHKKWEYKVAKHDIGNWCEVCRSEYS